MDKNTFPNDKIKCPLCAEEIRSDAIVCRFCRTRLIDSNGNRISTETAIATFHAAAEKKAEGVGLGQAMFANFLCPGLGSWRLGEKKRGAIIFGALTLCILLYAMDYITVINLQITEAMREHSTKGLEEKLTKLENNWWGTLSFWIYIYSFIDVYLIHRKKV
ncbi:MAG: hypothetical protein HQM08_21440 [Candidatus Riflebacteria bacterium]|nr:hypothetical protein [Candidatus Riflebacteria bacterium]